MVDGRSWSCTNSFSKYLTLKRGMAFFVVVFRGISYWEHKEHQLWHEKVCFDDGDILKLLLHRKGSF